MKVIKKVFSILLSGLLIAVHLTHAQKKPLTQVHPVEYKTSVHTESKPIVLQTKKVYQFAGTGVGAHNLFDGARLNDFVMINDSVYDAYIRPENIPINQSPWYAFKLWSSTTRNVTIRLQYENVNHRYAPKVSLNGLDWDLIPDSDIQVNDAANSAEVKIKLTSDTIWFAAQEVLTSKSVSDWCSSLASNHQNIMQVKDAGTSKLGRRLPYLDIHSGKKKNKKVIVILSRQHPPEVTGYLAMQAFVNGMLDDPRMVLFLKKYRVLVFPLLNPDGVDLGHWRHNAGGVDLNRDWAFYRQEEINTITRTIVGETYPYKNTVIAGLDFHSTWEDVYYTNNNTTTRLPGLKDRWLKDLEQELPDYHVNEKSSNPETPVSKAWFYKYFEAEGITYEIGDNTDREFIKEKGRVSATALIKALLDK